MQKKHLFLAVLVTAVWGLNFPVTKLGLAAIDPLLLTALRFTLAALPWVFFVKRPPIAIKWLAAYGLIFGVAMWALINLGIEWGVPPGTAALLIQFSAFFTMGWGVLLFREQLSYAQMLGMGLAVLGLISIILASPGQGTTLGYALLLVSALSWSVGNVIIKQSKVREMFAFVVWASVFPPLPLLLLTWLAHGSAPFTALVTHFEWVALFSLLFQVYAATHFCYWGWNLLLREYPVSRVAPLSLLIPVFGIAGSMLILGHRVGASEGVSIALILSALVVGLLKWPRGLRLLPRQ
ncbi:amino acid metabolite efflux pump [Pseudomonas fragi]|jgi:O-acetylserine/cysteine efflux transporter|uniref:Amino acid metabolite efflux pump n=1 Tax=Pseudomonas fragi TaxID=296 RepID=A0A9Q6VNV0_PSEFR|nr:amino acid metabolite efflux pump [Pseudomonas fragi]ARQ76288.1 amino acid metabolite efflux pump [Pseudomonas fragi]MBM1201819.1 amino acid metabolite efflux pump [Pseudomonas fragi]MDE4514953.1 amino acid metabolite efflux pump [Pseudomonas fragi]NNB08302.1 amino acid metabolite efflux pump [Pseudomonas fragi]NNB17082.1 amino acid metabolite efflux pump [Pseudomonas fragi]